MGIWILFFDVLLTFNMTFSLKTWQAFTVSLFNACHRVLDALFNNSVDFNIYCVQSHKGILVNVVIDT